ncbi:hypothetical protein HDV00_000403 [Rhizophlyctis rosea]|nr:hypothetical protein HDV00_000403 [Rhizophlyctis rosea]
MQAPLPAPSPSLTNPTRSTPTEPETLLHLKSDLLWRTQTFGPDAETTSLSKLALQHYAAAVTAGYVEPREQYVGKAAVPEDELCENIKLQLDAVGGKVLPGGADANVVGARLSDCAAALERAIESARAEGRRVV